MHATRLVALYCSNQRPQDDHYKHFPRTSNMPEAYALLVSHEERDSQGGYKLYAKAGGTFHELRCGCGAEVWKLYLEQPT